MTLGEGITLVLRRAGKSTSPTTEKDIARSYISLVLAEVVPLVDWWWLDLTTTFATVASTRSYQPVTGNVTAWHSFVDETENRPLEIIGADSYDVADPDRSDTGSPRAVFIAGLDATTGYPVLDIFPLPDTANTIRIRYRKDIDEFTSSDDASDFLTLGIPRIIESVLISGAVSYYEEEAGDDSGANRESGNFKRLLLAAKKQNVNMQGNRRYVAPTDDDGPLLTIDNTIVVA